jgi:outer membrane PBP1 activator LpoA protein
LIAYPSIARQIMPLLRYYFASDVPIYATSSVYSGIENTAKDRDLNGVIFCDMPWVFKHQLGQQHHWAEQLNSYNRLYALGMDSFVLSTQLNQLLLFPAIGMNDQSGVIYLTKSQKLSRILAFGQFRQGVAKMLEGTQDK